MVTRQVMHTGLMLEDKSTCAHLWVLWYLSCLFVQHLTFIYLGSPDEKARLLGCLACGQVEQEPTFQQVKVVNV